MSHIVKDCLALVPIFGTLNSQQKDEIAEIAQPKHFKKSEIIFQVHEKHQPFFIVHQGQVKLYFLNEEGKEQLIKQLKSGDFTNELAIFNDIETTFFAEATIDTEICMIDSQPFQKMLLHNPDIGSQMTIALANRLSEMNQLLEMVALPTIEQRVSSYLTSLTAENTYPQTLELPLAKKEIANLLATTPESITRAFKVLEDNGLLKMNGRKKVLLQQDLTL